MIKQKTEQVIWIIRAIRPIFCAELAPEMRSSFDLAYMTATLSLDSSWSGRFYDSSRNTAL